MSEISSENDERKRNRAAFRKLNSLARWLGIALNLILVFGLLLLPSRVITPVQETLRSTASSLRGFSSTFDRIRTSLDASATALESTLEALENTSSSIDQSTQVIDIASDILGDVGEGLIPNSQSALKRMEIAADGIDRTINFLAFLGLLESDGEQTQDSLGESIQELNRVLEGWPGEFEDLSGSLDEISTEIVEVTASLGEIQDDLEVFLAEIDELIQEMDQLSRNSEDTARDLETWADRVPLLSWSLFGFLAVIMVVNMLIQITSLFEKK